MSLVRRLIRQFFSQARLLRLVRANSDITPFSSSVRIAGDSGAIMLMTEEGQASIVSAERPSRAWAGLRLWKVPATLGYPDRSRGGESR